MKQHFTRVFCLNVDGTCGEAYLESDIEAWDQYVGGVAVVLKQESFIRIKDGGGLRISHAYLMGDRRNTYKRRTKSGPNPFERIDGNAFWIAESPRDDGDFASLTPPMLERFRDRYTNTKTKEGAQMIACKETSRRTDSGGSDL